MYTTAGPATVVNADFDGDGRLDLAVIDVSAGRVTVWRGDGRGGFGPATNVAAADRRRRSPGLLERLTARETEVARLLASAYTDREIARILGIGRRTVETHVASVRAKLRLKSRRELARPGGWPAA